MAHYSTKPCEDENCCCSGSLTVVGCSIQWSTTPSTVNAIVVNEENDTVGLGKSGILDSPQNGVYTLKVQCAADGEWVVADSVVFDPDEEDCCRETLDLGPSCMETLSAITGWLVTIDGFVGCADVANGTWVLDGSTLITTPNSKIWRLEMAGRSSNCVPVDFGGGFFFREYAYVNFWLRDTGFGRCRLAIGGAVSFNSIQYPSNAFSMSYGMNNSCSSSGELIAPHDLSFLGASTLNCTSRLQWEPL